jgi:hypothetical protein
VAEFVGRELLCHVNEVIVENGGDLFMSTRAVRPTIGILPVRLPLPSGWVW